MLEHLAVNILQAEDGEQARKLFGSGQNIALLITDVLMPGMTGPQLVESLLPEYPDLNVLYISGYTNGSTEVSRHLQEHGFSFLSKPFRTADFAGHVCAILGLPQGARAARKTPREALPSRVSAQAPAEVRRVTQRDQPRSAANRPERPKSEKRYYSPSLETTAHEFGDLRGRSNRIWAADGSEDLSAEIS